MSAPGRDPGKAIWGVQSTSRSRTRADSLTEQAARLCRHPGGAHLAVHSHSAAAPATRQHLPGPLGPDRSETGDLKPAGAASGRCVQVRALLKSWEVLRVCWAGAVRKVPATWEPATWAALWTEAQSLCSSASEDRTVSPVCFRGHQRQAAPSQFQQVALQRAGRSHTGSLGPDMTDPRWPLSSQDHGTFSVGHQEASRGGRSQNCILASGSHFITHRPFHVAP